MKKRIGISYTTTNFQYYWNWFTKEEIGSDIELVELSFQKNNTADIFTCDGFILTGGIDLDPQFYGGGETYENKPAAYQQERDAFEKKIFLHAQVYKLPLLAICRGMQLVQAVMGGTLIQDLGTLNTAHKKESDKDKLHEVFVDNDSLLYEITSSSSGKINSAHHQAIDKNAPGKNLRVSAYAEDSTAEAMEFADKTDHPFMLCVQWHPERIYEKEQNPFSAKIKERFLQEIRKTNMAKLTIINPATEETIAEVAEDNSGTIAKKEQLLRDGQPAWASTPVDQRVACITRFSELLDQEKDKLAATLTAETGKPLQQSYNELKGARTRMSFFIENAVKWLSEEWVVPDGSTREKIVYEPLGVIVNISAWNYPYLVGVNVIIPALLGGNSVFYKPSEYATLTGMHIQELLYRSGIPENCFQVAIGRGQVGSLLLDASFDGYFFTGSYRTGKLIAEKVASKLVPCQLELGGKDPLYVMDDVEDVDQTAAAVLEGVVYNNGQSCCAVERVYVHENIYDQFVQSYTEQAKKLKVGNPLDKSTDIGPLSRKEQVGFLLNQIDDAVTKGARLLTGGKKPDGKGYFIEPAVLVDVDHGMKIMTEESFGPVVGIQKVRNDEEAVARMQDSEYGLTAAVYSKSFERAEGVMKKINTGTVYWNCCDRVSAWLPWSGRKHSGLGTTLSYQGIRAFVQPKSYHIRG